MVSVGDRDQLELPLSLAKFSEALHCMPTNKSPGMDRLTVEFYRMFWDILGPNLVTVWTESLQSGVLPLSCSTDYKIVVKAILLHLGSMLEDQTYTVLGRTTFDNLYLVRDLLDLWLNWTLTEPVSFRWGVQQGCPLSGQLYTLAIEPFLSLLRQRLTGLVLREPELWLVLSAYANDMLLVVQYPGDLARVEACQTVYSVASSAWVNWVKSSGLVIGDGWQASSLPPALQAIRWSLGLLLYLGVYLSDMHSSPPENWHGLHGR
ncbi:unnamed protein product, partial [Caretta caretta]